MVMIFDTQEELNRFLQVNIAMWIFFHITIINCCHFINNFRATIHRQILICIVVLITHQVMLILHLKHCY
jgi:hypothetical protein